MTATTRIALVYPELLGTYGDGGNAMVLAARLRWRGLPAEVVSVPAGEPVPPDCQIYLLGGGEDEPQVLAAEGLRAGRNLARAVEDGAVVFAVCAGLQIVGRTFWGTDGVQHDGVGLLDLETRRSFGAPDEPVPPRAVGDIAVTPDEELGLPVVLGYENHGGRTRPLADALGRPFGRVHGSAIGNGTPDRAEGWWHATGARDVPARPGSGAESGTRGLAPGLGRPGSFSAGRRSGNSTSAHGPARCSLRLTCSNHIL